MSDFDPYYQWLGIPPNEQPPNRYRLLGLALYEANKGVIESAADRQMSFVRHHGIGPHSDASQKLLDEIAQTLIVLLNPTKKAAYDEMLKKQLEASTARPAREATARQEPVGAAATATSTATVAAGTRVAARAATVRAGATAETTTARVENPRRTGSNEPKGDRKSSGPRWDDKPKSDPGKGRAQRRRELEGLASLIPAAKQLIARHDYAEAAQLLEQVSVGDRTPEIEALRRKATDLEEESDMLLTDLRRAVQARELDGIDDNLNRLLELKPGNRFARELQESLQTYGSARSFRFNDRGQLLPAESKGLFEGMRLALVVGTVAFLGMAYAMTVYLKDDRQTVTVEVDESLLKDGTVSLVVEGQTLELKGLGDTIRLKPGPHGYEVRRGDSVVVGPSSYTVRKGDKNVLTISVASTAVAGSKPADGATAKTEPAAPLPPLEEWKGPAPAFDWTLAIQRPATIKNPNYTPALLTPQVYDGLFPTIPTRFLANKAMVYASGQGNTLTFEVESAGFAFVSCHFGYEGNTGGGWAETRWTAEKFAENGWQTVDDAAAGGKLVKADNRPRQLLVKFLMKGEQLKLQCNKYDPPFLILFERGSGAPSPIEQLPERLAAPAQPPRGAKEITISGQDGSTSRKTLFGPLRKGQIVRIQYLEGKWADMPSAPPGSPDDLELIHPNVPRLRMSGLAGEEAKFLTQIPGATAEKPFAFKAAEDYSELIFNNVDPKAGNNPGEVKYRVWIDDPTP